MAALENWYQFTDDDCRQLAEWQERFEREQDELNHTVYMRYKFARWLVERGVLDEFTVEAPTEDA